LDVQGGELDTTGWRWGGLLLTFALEGDREGGFYVLLNIEFVAAKPLLVAGYRLGASKEMLTKHSRFIRIAQIRIMR
jgi:hypothetical protein